ncbi:rhodanese-like domain-containing protein [Thiosulfatihalobacter marinus]|uniref:rhodanese-like domain-containing protein n=1 Tax=Thiosulfatihalobacter marinus TaxID=2792481 RepID=UPI0018D8FB07|nr:rhodanese-like domain-containing protein [Thiosulfatihalobacter marinus]
MAEMLTLTALAADPGRFHLIDVRGAQDCVAAHVNGAAHTSLADLEARASEIPAGKTPLTICGKGGGRSAEGAEILRQAGHSGALWLQGGTIGWNARQYLTESNSNGGPHS